MTDGDVKLAFFKKNFPLFFIYFVFKISVRVYFRFPFPLPFTDNSHHVLPSRFIFKINDKTLSTSLRGKGQNLAFFFQIWEFGVLVSKMTHCSMPDKKLKRKVRESISNCKSVSNYKSILNCKSISNFKSIISNHESNFILS